MSRTLPARLRALNIALNTALKTVLSTSDKFRRAAGRIGRIAAHTATVALMLSVPAAAYADTGEHDVGTAILAANDLPTVIGNLQTWIMGILWSLAGLYALIGAVYRTTAAGDPEQVSKGNAAFRNAAIGAGLGVLAPVLLQIVKSIVGG